MSQRHYNKIYTCGRLILQILQDSQANGIAIDVLPRICVAHNDKLIVGPGFDWICGGFNIGVMTKAFTDSERKRRAKVRQLAHERGLTPKQYRLRWGW